MAYRPQFPKLVSLLSLSVLAGSLFVAATCQTTKPSSDSTPPTISWDVYDFATDTHTTYGNAGGTVASTPGHSFRITCKANDSGGISQITLGGGGSYGCLQGNVGQNVSFGQVTDTQNLSPNANNEVLTDIFLLRNVDPDTWSCQQGFAFQGGSQTLHCTSKNYFAGSASSNLTITR